MTPEIIRAANLDEISHRAAVRIFETAAAVVDRQGSFSLVLAGGSTPRLLYELLAAPAFARLMPWRSTQVFFGDERWVGPNHRFSNFAMARRSMLDRVEIPAANIHRIPTELASPQAAADAYEQTLTRFFGPLSLQGQRPGSDGLTTRGFDLVLLGMGQDGHIASLFPGDKALAITDRKVAAVWPEAADPPLPRLTLTLPAINSASQVIFLVAGASKLAVVQTILGNPAEAAWRYPAACIRPQRKLIWYLAEKG